MAAVRAVSGYLTAVAQHLIAITGDESEAATRIDSFVARSDRVRAYVCAYVGMYVCTLFS